MYLVLIMNYYSKMLKYSDGIVQINVFSILFLAAHVYYVFVSLLSGFYNYSAILSCLFDFSSRNQCYFNRFRSKPYLLNSNNDYSSIPHALTLLSISFYAFFGYIVGCTIETFLKKIGRECDQHIDKFANWNELMTLKTRELKLKGIPIKQRRWILRWVEKYKQGFEPELIKFQSKAKRHKEKRKLARDKHQEKFKIGLKRKEDRKALTKELLQKWRDIQNNRTQKKVGKETATPTTPTPEETAKTEKVIISDKEIREYLRGVSTGIKGV